MLLNVCIELEKIMGALEVGWSDYNNLLLVFGSLNYVNHVREATPPGKFIPICEQLPVIKEPEDGFKVG